MFKWLHRILEPHCPECKAEVDESKFCRSCETLQHQLSVSEADRRKLLDLIIELNRKPELQAVPESAKPEELRPRTIPWRVQKQMLEAEDRRLAQVLQERARTMANQVHTDDKTAVNIQRGESGGLTAIIGDKSSTESIEQLEKELGIDDTKEGVS